VHKRLWDETNVQGYLDEAIWAYEKGFKLLNDYYIGVNYAFLLNVRSSRSEPADAITDFVLARRARRTVTKICDDLLQSFEGRDTSKPQVREMLYWLHATKAECALGLGDKEASKAILEKAAALTPQSWMLESTNEQLEKLRNLLARSPLEIIASK